MSAFNIDNAYLIDKFMGYDHHTGKFMYDEWNQLMPVVEKIEGVKLTDDGERVFSAGANVKIYYKACAIEYEPDDESGDEHGEWDTQTQGDTKLEAVYKAVVEYVKWYNETKKP